MVKRNQKKLFIKGKPQDCSNLLNTYLKLRFKKHINIGKMKMQNLKTQKDKSAHNFF